MARFRAASAAVAILLALCLPGATAADPPAPPPLPYVVSVAVSPVLVPPAAPVDVTVEARALAGRDVDVQLAEGGVWRTVARVTVGEDGTARVRLSRTAAARYGVRAYAPLAAGAAARSEEASFEVTAHGRGDPRAYRFMGVRRGAPVRWNPCAVVTYRVNGASPSALADLREALRRVSYETGIRFRELGRTTGVPGTRGFRYDADVVVAWVKGRGSSYLTDDRVAAGGYETPVAGRGGRPRIRNGFVVVDADAVATMPAGFGEGVTVGQVLLHELGHLVGLDHLDVEHQLMRPLLGKVTATLYGAGDLTGLRRLGRRGGCL